MKPDLVVFELRTPFKRTETVGPACLPKKPVEPGSFCYASGWGSINQDIFNPNWHEAGHFHPSQPASSTLTNSFFFVQIFTPSSWRNG